MRRSARGRGIRTTYRFGPACIELTSDDAATARWLAEFVTPWFASGPPADRPLRVSFTASAAAHAALERRRASAALEPRACFALDREVVELPGWSEDGGVVIADRERGCFYRVRARSVEVVAQPDAQRARVGLLRVMRELAAAPTLAQHGVLDLHAAAFAIGGRGILFAGPKQAGKTTLLVAALASARASLLANDRVVIDTRGAMRAHGVPTLVSLRTGTLRWFPGVARGLPERPALLDRAELAASPAAADLPAPLHLSLSPAQLARQLDAQLTASARLAAIVFPELSPATATGSIEPLPPEEGVARLRESLYGGGRAPTTLFAQAALGAAAPLPPPGAEAIERLAARVPLFRFRVGPHLHRHGADAWLRRLPLEPARRRRVA